MFKCACALVCVCVSAVQFREHTSSGFTRHYVMRVYKISPVKILHDVH